MAGKTEAARSLIAYRETWQKGINPEAVPKLLEAVHAFLHSACPPPQANRCPRTARERNQLHRRALDLARAAIDAAGGWD